MRFSGVCPDACTQDLHTAQQFACTPAAQSGLKSNQILHKKIYQLALRPTAIFSIAGKAKLNPARPGYSVLPWPARF